MGNTVVTSYARRYVECLTKKEPVKKNNFNPILMRWILLAFVTLALSACAKPGSTSLVGKGKIVTSVSSIAHYGKGIGIAEFYINGKWKGSQYNGWGGGGSFACCVSLLTTPDKPLMVDVKWKTYRTSFKEERWHEATVPLNISEAKPGSGYELAVHFLPGHKVELWIADKGTGAEDYPGPKYPYKPAPDYAPLPDEAPEPEQGKQK